LNLISYQNNASDPLDTPAYFRKLKFRLRFGVLVSFLVPLATLSVYFHFQFTSTLKGSGKLNMVAIAESQRNTIDLFLQERVINLFSQFQSEAFSFSPSPHIMENYFQNLRRVSDAFIDVGFLNESGAQIGYAGPYPYLQDKNYAEEDWFKALMASDRNHFVSDIYLGFRNKPHFTIAVKQIIDGHAYVMRSTLDPDKFYLFMRTMSQEKGIDSALISHQGVYQLVDPTHGNILEMSDFKPSTEMGSGAQEIELNNAPALIAYAWLRETPWTLIVRQPLSISHGKMLRARQIIIAGTVLFFIVIALAVWFSTSAFIKKAQINAERREQLQLQLLHASKLASVGELATSVAHEINNPLAIVIATTGVVRDMLNPEFEMDSSPEHILKELDTIDAAVLRARTITRQLLNFGRKNPVQPVPCNLNHLIDDVMSGFKQRSLEVENIKIHKQYESELPEIMADPDQLRQIFLNLLNNAGDATPAGGTITITTAGDDKTVRVTVTDTGKGMTSEEMKKIFDPFFTTKQAGKGTGLGLSISLGLVKSMGGSIEVQSVPSRGSSFTVLLPIDIAGRKNHADTRTI
jgi:two-component system NtrC family sensor kinase